MKVFEIRFWKHDEGLPETKQGYTPLNEEADTVATLRVGPYIAGWAVIEYT